MSILESQIDRSIDIETISATKEDSFLEMEITLFRDYRGRDSWDWDGRVSFTDPVCGYCNGRYNASRGLTCDCD